MAVVFTTEQQRVIDLREKNILVSAAAGSGKTAVLTERIVKKISQGESLVNIDRLLVVTFTNAAAAQMRERIGAAIEKRLEKEPDNEHLQKQTTLIHNAQITTIHSFCLFVIRNNFNDIGLDPGFRIADEGELKLIKKDVMDQVMEDKYGQGESGFLYLVEYFGTGNRDTALEEHVSKLYDFARSYPWPKEWLYARKKDYLLGDLEALEQSEVASFSMKQAVLLAMDCKRKLMVCLQICNLPDGPYMYGDVLEKEVERVEKLTKLTSYQEGYGSFCAMTFDRLPSKKDDSVDPGKREMVQGIRKEIKAMIGKICDTFFPAPPDTVLSYMQGCEVAVSELIDLTVAYMDALDLAKREANVLDFGDIEHFALAILLDKNAEGVCKPSRTAIEYSDYFEEVLIDEYQDSNLVQEYILKSVSGEEKNIYNRFMVGDVKQSIYRFRLARPELFMEKYDSYHLEEGENIRIDLHKNFRSRKEVIDSVNYIFRRIMIKELGGVAYDEKAALYPGACFLDPPEIEHNRYATELLLVKKETDCDNIENDLSPKATEAHAIADRIKELVGQMDVTDELSQKMRKAVFGDIVILLRTNAGWDDAFKAVFDEQGIPAHITSRTGYFAASEVQTLLQLLRVLDNPLQNIPLLGVLKSFYGRFTDEELALLRGGGEEKYFYQILSQFGQCETAQEQLQQKVNDFLSYVEDYRKKAVYMPVHELLREVIVKSGYMNYVAALPSGEQRRANVEILLEKAIAFGKTSYYGLFHFVRYMEQLEKYDVDYGEANTLDENADVVRIMSIHKSKGLEFPICFVSGMSKRFNMQDASGRLIADVDMGIGADYVDVSKRVLGRTLRKNAVAEKMKMDNLGEELRVLYVAMTRAKEKLIMTGVIDREEGILEALYPERLEGGEQLSYGTLARANSFMDFVLPALATHSALDGLFQEAGYHIRHEETKGQANIKVNLVGIKERIQHQLQTHVGAEQLRRILERDNQLTEVDNTFVTVLDEKLDCVYEHSSLAGLYTKTTVSELKKIGQTEVSEGSYSLYEEVEVVPYIPAFMRQEEALGGAGRGSAYHKVMELMEFTEEVSYFKQEEQQKWVEDYILKLHKMGSLSEAYAQAVSAKQIAVFLQTSLAKRMAKAAELFLLRKEQPFVLGLSAKELNETFPPEETVLVQGIIDVFFEEEGELVVVDYKTDRVGEAKELVDKYEKQLGYYSTALEALTGKRVKEKIIYSFGLDMEIFL